MSEKIGIKRLDHVCWAVRKLEDALPLLTGLMGMTVARRWQDEEKGFRGMSLELPGGTAHVELLEPLGDDSFLHRYLNERGPGLHHVTFEVDDVHLAADAIREYGIEPIGGVSRSSRWNETFIHPRDSSGVLFQFYAEAEDDREPEAPK